MINLVMFHSSASHNGSKVLPVFLECTFKQIRLFNPGVVVYFITDKDSLNNPLFEKYEITVFDKDLFYSDKIEQFGKLYNYSLDHFWTLVATRLIYIENFLKDHRLTNVYHFENDVLLYYGLKSYHKKFQDLYKHMAITPGGPDRNMTGFMFIKNWKPLSMMTQFFIEMLRMHNLEELKEKYKTDMVHEMSLMKMFEVEKGLKYLSYLPILPFGQCAYNYDEFNSIFDPASWGQFVGGTFRGKNLKQKSKDHYIGQLLIDNPDYTVIWKEDVEGRKIPYFKYNDNYNDHEIKINNLHIHSKNLDLYAS